MLELYYSENCPYCKKVLSFFTENSVEFKKKDVTNTEYYNELMERGKIMQVPFLYDSEKNLSLYESDVIIDYVKNLNL